MVKIKDVTIKLDEALDSFKKLDKAVQGLQYVPELKGTKEKEQLLSLNFQLDAIGKKLHELSMLID